MSTTNVEYTTLARLLKNQSDSHFVTSIKDQYLTLQCYPQLSNTVTMSNLEFMNRVGEMNRMGDIAIAYEQTENNIIILGIGSLCIELKIDNKNIGHIDNIVIHPGFMEQEKTVQEIVNRLTRLAFNNSCYIVIINSKRDLSKKFEELGYTINGIEMVKYNNNIINHNNRAL